MIDFHVIKHPIYKRTCFEFVHPLCAIHKVSGVANHIGEGRFAGFTQGVNKYVSFYDDDDSLNLHVIDKIIERMENDSSIDAVCTNENVLQNGILKSRKKPLKDGAVLRLRDVSHVHHLVVVRRKSIEPFLNLLLDWPDWCEFSLWATMVKSGCKFSWMSDFGYTWVMHEQNAKSMKIKPNASSVALIKEIFS